MCCVGRQVILSERYASGVHLSVIWGNTSTSAVFPISHSKRTTSGHHSKANVYFIVYKGYNNGVILPWNALQRQLRDADSHYCFKRKLVMHYDNLVTYFDIDNVSTWSGARRCHSCFCNCVAPRSNSTIIYYFYKYLIL